MIAAYFLIDKVSVYLKLVREGIMQEYYNKKAKECEAAVDQLQQQIARMNKADADSLQAQMEKVRREMKNYQAALNTATAEA
ncbi:MAG: hypothetical protein V7765_09650 [Oleispira sp.]